jgi:hypothetical protein
VEILPQNPFAAAAKKNNKMQQKNAIFNHPFQIIII